jgi:GTPase SAR1 family protein
MQGTVKRNQLCNMPECRVMVVGDKGVGKSALIRRFANGMFVEVNIYYSMRNNIVLFFLQMFSVLPKVQTEKIHFVGRRRTKFEIVELNDLTALKENLTQNDFQESDLLIQNIKSDAILLCFSISSLSSLSNAVTYWVPSLTASSPSTPLVLVGCKSDMRSQGSISSQQALAMSRHCGAVMYVETSAKISDKSAASAFEVAALSAQRQYSRQSSVISTTSMSCSSSKPRSRLFNRRDHSEPRLRGSTLNCLNPCPMKPSPQSMRSRTSSLSSTSLCSKSSTLSSTRSDSSVLSISTTKTPHVTRRQVNKVKKEETVTIKCQRINKHKEVEEVEIEVLANVYNNIESGDSDSNFLRNSIERKSLGSKLKRLILKD